MIEQLFGSKTRVKLLQLFFSNLNRAFYVREITRKIDEQINSVRRELANLLSIGIISSDTTNNRLYYEVNQKHEYFKPLLAIFGNQTKNAKKTKEESDEAKQLRTLGNLNLVLLTGRFTRDESIEVDLVIVGDVAQPKLQKYIEELERQESREIRYTVMAEEEFAYRRQVNDRFVSNLMGAKKQVLIDKDNMLTEKK